MKKIIILLALLVLLTACDSAGKAIELPQNAVLVVGSQASGATSSEVVVAASVAGHFGVTESETDQEANINEEGIVIVGTGNGGRYTNALIPQFFTATSIPSSVLDTYQGVIIIREDIPQILVVGRTQADLEVIGQYLTTHADDMEGTFFAFGGGEITNLCNNGMQDFNEDGIDCGGDCGSCFSAVRSLPSMAEAGVPFTVSIDVVVGNAVNTVLVQETLPSGCVLESSNLVVAGSTNLNWFFSQGGLIGNELQDSTIEYDVLCTNQGTTTFSGTVSKVDVNNPINGETTLSLSAPLDSDNDGTADTNDCDPLDATIHPGAAEMCNGVDDNCNTIIDEGNTCDVDGDGAKSHCFGDPNCELDCDDGDAEVAPTFAEMCDGKDNDCDGAVDLQADGLTPIMSATVCNQLGICSGAVAPCVMGSFDASLCNIFPLEEVCEGALDEDCDGSVDEADMCAGECSLGDEINCGVGQCAGVQTCSADGTYGICTGAAPSDEICDNIDNDCNGIVDDDCYTFVNEEPLLSLFDRTRSDDIDFTVVVGTPASPEDSIGAIDASGKLGIPNTVVAEDVDYAKNLIIVGGPCANEAAGVFMDRVWEPMGSELYPVPGCEFGFESGKGTIELKQFDDGKVYVLIAGYDAADTRRAARAIVKYTEVDIRNSFEAKAVDVTGSSLNEFTVTTR